MKLPEVLMAVRAHASLTLAGLAEKLGSVTRQALGHYEQGIRHPDPSRIANIAKACGVWITAGPDGEWSWKPKKGRK